MRIRHLLLSLSATLKQAGDEVTGWVGRPVRDGWVGPSEYDAIPLSGTVKKGKLVLKTRPRPGQIVAFDEVELSIKGETMCVRSK